MISRFQFWFLLVAINTAVWLLLFRHRAETQTLSGQTTAIASAQTARSTKPAPPIVVRTNAFEWTQLESEDYRTYIHRLRSIGCPEETIRDIVIADLEKLMAPEVKEVEGERPHPKYWEPKKIARTLESLEKIGKKQEIDFRKREIIRELLGIDLATERSRTRGESDFYGERLGFLSPEKQMKVRMEIEKANQEENALRESSWLDNDQLTIKDREQVREIQQQKEARVAELLSPEELEQYNLWFSPSAYKVRDAFLALEPNEQDFLALYQIQREFDAKWDGIDPQSLTPAQKVEYDQAQTARDAAIREHLGPERYEKYLLTREPDFQQLQETITQFALKPDVAGNVFEFKKALREERQRVASSESLPEQKQEILKALSEETERAVVETMGPRPYRYYVRTGAARWIWE